MSLLFHLADRIGLRQGQPWGETLPRLAGLGYGWILLGNLPPQDAYLTLLFLGIAYGGGGALFQGIKTQNPYWILASLPALALPWALHFPLGWSTLGLFGLTTGLILVHGLMFIQKGQWTWIRAWIATACNELLPAVLLSLILFFEGSRSFPYWWQAIALIGLWSGIGGFRKRQEQKEDSTRFTPVLVGLEALAWAGLVTAIGLEKPMLAMLIVGYYLHLGFRKYFVEPATKGREYWTKIGLDSCYRHWFPFVFLMALMTESIQYWPLLLAHLLLLPNVLVEGWKTYHFWRPKQRIKFSTFLLCCLMFGQMVQLLVTRSEYYPALVLPMFDNAPSGEVTYRKAIINLLGQEENRVVSLREFLPELQESHRNVFLQKNLGHQPENQNKALDFKVWLKSHCQTIQPDKSWVGVKVEWLQIGESELLLGAYSLKWTLEEGKNG